MSNTDNKSEQMDTEKAIGKSSKTGLKIGIGVGTAAAVLAVAYVGASVYFNTHFYPKTTINGIAAGGSTVSEVNDLIQETADGYKVSIYDENGTVIDEISADEVGLASNDNEAVIQDFLDTQNKFRLPHQFFTQYIYESDELVSVDETAVKKTVSSLNCVKKSGSVESENATCAFNGEEFEIVPEVVGNNIEKNDLTDKLCDMLVNLPSEIHLDTDGCYVQPEYTSDSQEIIDLCDELNEAVNVSIVYDLNGEVKETVSKETIAGFITIGDDDISFSYNDYALFDFIDEMAEKYDTYGKDKTLVTSYGDTVTVKGKSYGWQIDKENEFYQLKADLEAGNGLDRDFVYSSTANSRGENDYGNTYVEINLTAQHLFMYVDGKLIVETDFVSGNPNKGNATPVGACQVTYTTRNATLRGQGYASFVNYWMPFNGNVGLHDATWRNKFGGTIYKSNGSHGCVNLPLSVAKTIYENLNKGDCILVYSLDGTEELATTTEEVDNTAATNQEDTQPAEDTTQQTQPTAEEQYYYWLMEQMAGGSTGGDTTVDPGSTDVTPNVTPDATNVTPDVTTDVVTDPVVVDGLPQE